MSSVTEALSNPSLTTREKEFLTFIASGTSNKDIAARLFISEATVKAHVTSLFSKLGVKSRTEAVVIASRRGLVRLSK